MQRALPIWQIHEQIIAAIATGKPLVLVAPTGCAVSRRTVTSESSARGASSPRKGPCPPLQVSTTRHFFQPDVGGLQALS